MIYRAQDRDCHLPRQLIRCLHHWLWGGMLQLLSGLIEMLKADMCRPGHLMHGNQLQ